MSGRSLVAFAGGAILALALSACGGTPNNLSPTKPPLATPTPVGIETPPAGRIYLGAFVPTFATPDPNASPTAPPGTIGIAGLEAEVGRTFAINMHYYPWISLFPGLQEAADFANGRLPVESWDCGIPNAAVAAGQADPLITTRALALKSYGHPVFLRYMWDMNLHFNDPTMMRTSCYDKTTDNPDGTFSARQYIAAWTHIRAIFAQNNVTNVIWVWSVSASTAAVNPSPFYPGNSQVDWVGSDALDTQNAGFVSTFKATYPTVSTYAKPIMIAQTGASASGQATFFNGGVQALQSQFPLVDAFVYYNGHFPAVGGTDYSLSGQGLAAFTAFAADPYLSAFGSL